MKPPARKAKPQAWAAVGAGLILLAALLLRLASVNKFAAQFDEQILRAVVSNIWSGDLTNNWIHAKIPSELFRIDCYNFSSYFYADSVFVGLIRLAARSVSWPLAYTVVLDRALSVILGTGSIYLFYLLALRLYDRSVALTAAALMAVMPLLVQDSHYGRPEAFLTFVTGVAYLASLQAMRKTAYLRHLMAACVCFGILVACKVSMVPLCAVPLVCLWSQSRLTIRTAAISVGCTLLGCFLGVYDAFFHPRAFWKGVTFLRMQYSGAFPPHAPHAMVDGSVVVSLMLKYFWETLGPVFCLIAILGMLAMLRAKQYLYFSLLVGPVLFYVGYFSLQKTFFERNVSHVAPFMAICFAVGAVYLADLMPPRKLRPYALAAFAVLGAAAPLWTSCVLVFKAMPVTPESRAAAYEKKLIARVGAPIGIHTHLLTHDIVEHIVRNRASLSDSILIRALDYQDSFTQKYLRELLAATGARQVGYFPSLFPRFSVNTLVSLHSPAFRYVFLPAPPEHAVGRFVFVSWDRVGEPLQPDRLDPGTWIENGYYPDTGPPPRPVRVWGSFNKLGDANEGTLRMGPFPVAGLKGVGVPLVTGPVSAGLSISVLDHATGRAVAQMAPPPLLASWGVWLVDLNQSRVSQIDIVAGDGSAEWGQWLAVGMPVQIRDRRN